MITSAPSPCPHCGRTDQLLETATESNMGETPLEHRLAEAQAKLKQCEEDALNMANLLTDIAQILNVVEQEWVAANSWSEWDQQVRNRVTAALAALSSPQIDIYAPSPVTTDRIPEEK